MGGGDALTILCRAQCHPPDPPGAGGSKRRASLRIKSGLETFQDTRVSTEVVICSPLASEEKASAFEYKGAPLPELASRRDPISPTNQDIRRNIRRPTRYTQTADRCYTIHLLHSYLSQRQHHPQCLPPSPLPASAVTPRSPRPCRRSCCPNTTVSLSFFLSLGTHVLERNNI